MTAKAKITVYFVLLVLLCAVFTFGLSSYLRDTGERTSGQVHLIQCIEVVAGDTMRVHYRGREEMIRLVGVEAPLTPGHARMREQAERLGREPAEWAEWGRVSRNTLSAWILKRRMRLAFPFGAEARDDDGRLLVYAELYGVDVGAKMLEGGLVFADGADHARLDRYRALEQHARNRQIGLWTQR